MRSIKWQLGILGTISAFAYRHRGTKKSLWGTFIIIIIIIIIIINCNWVVTR